MQKIIQTLKRELAMRHVVYPKQVKRGKMKQEQADAEIKNMEDALLIFEGLSDQEGAAAKATGLVWRERAVQLGKWDDVEMSLGCWILAIEQDLEKAKREWIAQRHDGAGLRYVVRLAASAQNALEQHV